MPGRDELYFNVEVQSTEAQRQLFVLQRKFRDVGDSAIASGKEVDIAAQKNIRSAAAEVVAFEKVEQAHKAANAATQASIARSRSNATIAGNNASVSTARAAATPDLLRNQVATGAAKAQVEQTRATNLQQEQLNRNLESEGRQRLINDKIQRAADEAALKAERLREAEIQKLAAQQARAAAQQQAAAEAQGALYAKYLAEQQAGVARLAASQQTRIQNMGRAESAAYAEDAKRTAAKQAASDRAAVAAQRNAQAIGRAESAAYAENARRTASASFGSAGDPEKLNATRNALYGTATAAGIAGVAIGAFGAYSVVAAAQFQTSFADVQRAAELTDTNIDSVRQGLVDLSTTLPTGFAELSDVATLGAQLGIAANDLDSFTEVVAKFSATTNVDSQSAGTAFGRISNLLDVNPQDFDKLGASIYEVGIKSVATESEILSMSQQIAGAAATYKISAQDVIGLSSAFASLAIAPEAARGSITRIFSKINSAVHEGGDALQAYADIMGTTSEDAAKLFKTDPTQFFQSLIQGLSTAKDLDAALTSIKANDVRDKNLFQRLAGNPELLSKSIKTANDAYNQGTALNKGYAVTLNTLSAQLKIFANSFKALGAELGGPILAPLQGIIVLLSELVKFFAGNKIALGIGAVALALSLLVGGFLLLKAAEAAAIAGLLSARSALALMSKEAATASISLRTVFVQLVALGRGAGLAGAGVGAASTKLTGLKAAAAGLAGAAGPLLAIAAAGVAVNYVVGQLHDTFDSASDQGLKFVGSYDGLGDALTADAEGGKKAGKILATFRSTTDDVKKSTDDSSTSASNLATVLDTDLPAAGKKSEAAAKGQTLAWGETTNAYIKAQLAASSNFKNSYATSDSFTKYFKQIGATQKGYLAAAAKDGQQGVKDYFAKLEGQAALEGKKVDQGAYHFDINKGQLDQGFMVSDAQQGVEDLAKAVGGYKDEAQKAANSNVVLGDSSKQAAAKARAQSEATDALTTATDGMGAASDTTADKIANVFTNTNAISDYASAVQTLFSGIADGGKSFDYLSDSGRTNLSNLQAAMASTIDYGKSVGIDASTSIDLLFKQLQASGVDTASLLKQLGANPYTFYATLDVTDVQQKLATIGQQFQANDLGGAFSGLGSAIAQIGLDAVKTATPAVSDFNIGLQGLAKTAPVAATATKGVGDAAKDTAKEVRTLHDYMDDLNTVMDDAKEYRFGASDARDKITAGWRDTKKAVTDVNDEVKNQKKDIEDARQKLKEYNADLLQLQSKLSQDKYFKKVADRFGDKLRSQQIGADIATDNADISGKKKDIADQKKAITDAQKAIQAALKPVTKTMDEQDQELGDLVGSYQDLITQWASSGMSSDELKTRVGKLKDEFVKQATQAGYSKTAISKYAGAFDDMKIAIDKVPKNVTVKVAANTSPGEHAVADFINKANHQNAKPSVGQGTAPAAGRAGSAAGASFGNAFKTQVDQIVARSVVDVATSISNAFSGVAQSGGKAANKKIKWEDSGGSFFDGGFVPGKNAFPIGGFVPGATPSNRRMDNVLGSVGGGGVVSLQGGEPIMTNAARSKYGDAMFEQINALKFRPNITVINQQSGGGGPVVAYLSAQDRALLRSIAERPVRAEVSYIDTARAAARGNKQLVFGG